MSAELVEAAAEALGPLLPDVVFLGGAQRADELCRRIDAIVASAAS
jgi:hypothetical protein